ncbi:MAG: type II toxin-antitoxin system CcdA family antitoxin [Magnetococcales bacterium]|nr:type II toxin-antitoxin system CcdA family antitoxin [Magnetococcales bacterium]NGZ28660.1 type II toxin-antitoxin system CcdA family antitoxin [Magnetococcales bacterium]
MGKPLLDPLAPKRPLNVRINSALVTQAKELKINFSQELENRLVQVIAERKRQAWQEENQTAMEVYNQRMERDGLFSDGERLF